MFTVACLIYIWSNSHTKFGWISSNGWGGDSIMDGQMDRHLYEWIHVGLRVFGNFKWPTRVHS